MKWSTPVLASLETAIRYALQWDPFTRQRCNEWLGRILVVSILQPEMTIAVYFDMGQIRLSSEDIPLDAHARIEGTSLSVLRGFLTENAPASLGLRIEGDTQWVAQLRTAMKALDIQWEEPLAQLMGDPAAHHIGQAARHTWRWMHNTAHTLLNNARAYWVDELHWLPEKGELDTYLNAVDTLRMDTERLQCRIQQLNTHRLP